MMKHEDSQTLSWLLAEGNNLQKANLKKNETITLLKLINAPANLHLLFQALKNLPYVLRIAHDIYHMDTEVFPDIDFTTAISAVDNLLNIENNLSNCAALAGIFLQSGMSVRSQLHGTLLSHPLYCCLCFRPNRSANNLIYQQLLAQILLATKIIEPSKKVQLAASKSYLSVRKLTEKKFENQLMTLPNETLPALDYLAATGKATANSHVRKASYILHHAYRGVRRRKKNKTSDLAKESEGRFSIEHLEDYENPETISTGGSFIPGNILTKRRAHQYAKHGGNPAEFVGGKLEIAVALPDENAYTGPTLRELAYQGKQRSNQEAMRNQFNPLGWNELNEYDCHTLLQFLLGGASTNSANTSISHLLDYLSLMFWLSAPLERIMRLVKFNGAPTQKSGEGLYLLNNKTLLARLHSPGPPLAHDSISTTSRLAIPVRYFSNVPLPMVAHTDSLLRTFQNSKEGEFSTCPPEDTDEIKDIKRQLKSLLIHLNKIHGTRLSLGRISHYWLHGLGMHPGEDMSSALLFFGHITKSSDSRAYYTCVPAQRMETTYRKKCSELLQSLGIRENFPDNLLVNEKIFLGTPYCPKPESVKDLIKSLQNAIEQSRPTKKSLGMIRLFHNHYAIYTACLIAFATTYRAVHDPSFSERDIHFTSGLGIISDKDDKTKYHSRFVWIADICRQQIINYSRHLQRLYEIIAMRNPAIFKLFNQENRQGRPLHLFFMPRGNTNLKTLRPGRLEKLLKERHNYDLPANANRHYLKNELIKSGCTPDIIEAQLGHWDQGQEPWNRFSNLHPREFCRQLDLHLTPILERDGWKAIEGLSI